jgi:hypothetical protein
VLAAWNGLTIAAFAEAARSLAAAGEADQLALAARYRETATRAADAVLVHLRRPDGRLRRSWRDGRASSDGVLEDYANLADGLLALYEATFVERWFSARQGPRRRGSPLRPLGWGLLRHRRRRGAASSRPRDVQGQRDASGGSMTVRSCCGSRR